MNDIKFIHIGKCGGTFIAHKFSLTGYHLKQPPLDDPSQKYIIWLRNPISRFISAFNFAYCLITSNVDPLTAHELTLENSLAPIRLRNKLITGYTFSEEYDQLVSFFKTPNTLAEAITSSDNELREKALELMNHGSEHIYKGIGWYLYNGDFIDKNHQNIIFVGTLENMQNDTNTLSITIDKTPLDIKPLRKNNGGDTYLSPLAIRNIINFYKDTDYKALDKLYRYNFITKELLDSYYKY
jgi:hypothetical protein